jgi:HlyD family secretion protein
MLAESFIRTAERTPFEYMVKPLKDQINRAFRER